MSLRFEVLGCEAGKSCPNHIYTNIPMLLANSIKSTEYFLPYFHLKHPRWEEPCENSKRISRMRYNPTKGSAFRIPSRHFNSHIEHCVIEKPTGEKMQFSRNPDKNNPNMTR